MEITVTRALVELKLLDKRINDGVDSLVVVAVTQGQSIVPGQTSNGAFIDTGQAKLQSLNQLILNRRKIKSAIVASNAAVKLTIGDEQITVAEAIERKNSIGYEEALLTSIKQQYATALKKVEGGNAQVRENMNNVVQQALKASDASTAINIQDIQDTFFKANQWKLIAPQRLEGFIADLNEQIQTFKANVDTALSEVNAVTIITVDI